MVKYFKLTANVLICRERTMIDKMFNPTPTFYKWDRFWIGLIPGMICPLLAFVFFYLLQIGDISFINYVRSVQSPELLSKIISFGCVINLGVFFLFINRNYYNASRGVIGATLLWGIPIAVIKIVV